MERNIGEPDKDKAGFRQRQDDTKKQAKKGIGHKEIGYEEEIG